MNTTLGTCTRYPAQFADEILSFNPADPEHASLTPTEKAEMTARRTQAEADAIEICAGCPLLEQCREQVLKIDVYGVAGGLTAEQRRALSPSVDESFDEYVDERERAWRGRVNDDAIAKYTRLGWTNEQIAAELECTPRTVARSRARMRSHEEVTPVAVKAKSAMVSRARVSPAMQAVYDLLADGEWHDREELLSAAIELIPADNALMEFDRKRPNDTGTALADRISRGRRAIADNALSASARVRGRTERDPNNRNQYRLAVTIAEQSFVRTAA